MRWAAALLVPVLAACSTIGNDDRPVLAREVYNEDGRLEQVVQVSIEGGLSGRSCQMLEISDTGNVSFWQQQDGSSDWGTLRAIVAVLPETVAAAMLVVNGPFEIVRDIIGNRPPMAAPSEIHGCAELLGHGGPGTIDQPSFIDRVKRFFGGG